MPPFRSISGTAAGLLGLVALPMLLASGCDYWRNLSEEVAADRANLTLTVLDALTGEPLADASCGKDGRDFRQADEAGVIDRDDMPTGQYKLVCQAPSYHPRTILFDLKLGETQNDSVNLVRMGGDKWYPGDDGRKVAIQLLNGNGRYPGALLFKALPEDTSGTFIYEWTSNLQADPLECQTSVCLLNIDAVDAAWMNLRLGVKVSYKPKWATAEYPVGTANISHRLVRNQPPHILLNTAYQELKPGCNVEDWVSIGYSALDADGDSSCAVHISTTDPFSRLGRIDTVAACGDSMAFSFRVPANSGTAGQVGSKLNNLLFRVVDGNGEWDTATYAVKTIANKNPQVTISTLNTSMHVFTSTLVGFDLYASDPELGRLDSLVLEWGDGSRDHLYLRHQEIPYRTVYRHKFANRGIYRIRATAYDACKGLTSAEEEIKVVENHPPEILSVTPKGLNRQTGEFSLDVRIRDEDIEDELDTLSLLVQWDLLRLTDFNQSTYPGEPNQHFSQVVGHVYDTSRTAAEFTIRLAVTDNHGGLTEKRITIPRLEAIPDPPPPPPASPGEQRP